MDSFGSRLKSLRTEAKLTQEELVNQINSTFDLKINKGMVSKWESDKVEPRVNVVIALASVFHVSLDFLLGLDYNSSSIFERQSEYEIDKSDLELLIASLENSLCLAKKIASKKNT